MKTGGSERYSGMLGATQLVKSKALVPRSVPCCEELSEMWREGEGRLAAMFMHFLASGVKKLTERKK